MDKEEARKVYESVADGLMLGFTSYYKYSFSFNGERDGVKVFLSFGGNADDIYRHNVDSSLFSAPKTLDELHDSYNYIKITSKDGKVYEHFDY